MALRKCPDLVIAKSDLTVYQMLQSVQRDLCILCACNGILFQLMKVFLDMTGTSLIYPDPVRTAHEIKDKIRNELGFTVNVGISANKLLAKMASDFEKPDKVHTHFSRGDSDEDVAASGT